MFLLLKQNIFPTVEPLRMKDKHAHKPTHTDTHTQTHAHTHLIFCNQNHNRSVTVYQTIYHINRLILILIQRAQKAATVSVCDKLTNYETASAFSRVLKHTHTHAHTISKKASHKIHVALGWNPYRHQLYSWRT